MATIGPFDRYANATLFVPVAGNDYMTDEWGNKRPVSEKQPIKAWIKEDKNQPKINRQAGTDTSMTYVRGYLTNPMKWPGGKRPSKVEIEIDGRMGELQILSQLPRPFQTEDRTGDRIEGWLRFQV